MSRSSISLGEKLLAKATELYEQAVKNGIQFEMQRTETKEIINEFRRALAACEANIERIKIERNQKETQLLVKIDALEQRLNMLSEQALHKVMKEEAKSWIEKHLTANPDALKLPQSPDVNSPKDSQEDKANDDQ